MTTAAIKLALVCSIFIYSKVYCTAETEYAVENGVIILNDTNYQQFLKTHKRALIQYYATMCQYCYDLLPHYEKVAKLLNGSMAVAKVNGPINHEIVVNESIKRYPTIKLTMGTFWEVFDGDLDADSILSWIDHITKPNYVPSKNALVEVSTENFRSKLGTQPLALLFFYTYNCAECIQIAPILERAAQLLLDSDPPIQIFKINSKLEPRLAEDYGIFSYPSLRIIRQGSTFSYGGPMDGKGIASYMTKMATLPAKKIETAVELKKWKKNNTETLILAILDGHKSWIYENFIEAAHKYRDSYPEMSYTFNPSLRQYIDGATEDKWLFLMLPEILTSVHEKRTRALSKDKIKLEDIDNFLLEKSIPLVGLRESHNANSTYRQLDKPLVVAYYTVDFDAPFTRTTQFWREKIANVAKDYPDYVFAISDEDEFSDELQEADLNDSVMDINVIATSIDGRMFRMEPTEYEDFSEEALRDFMAKLNTGKLQMYKRIVQTHPEGPVKVVTGETFKQIVYDQSKDVLILLYASWCGHCNQLQPIYEELAEKLNETTDLVIAKMDAIHNKLDPNYPAPVFPTIYLAPKNNKDTPLLYKGQRTLEAMTDFVNSHLTVSLSDVREKREL